MEHILRQKLSPSQSEAVWRGRVSWHVLQGLPLPGPLRSDVEMPRPHHSSPSHSRPSTSRTVTVGRIIQLKSSWRWSLRYLVRTCRSVPLPNRAKLSGKAIGLHQCGQVPLSVWSHVNVLTYHARLYNLPDTAMVKQVYSELSNLSNCGFTTWVSHVRDLANMHNVELYNVGDLQT